MIQCALAQNAANSKSQLDGLIIDGDGFVFSVTEPKGWHADTGHIATEYQVNVVFFPSLAQSRERHMNIRVRLNDKSDENTAEDLQADMRGYKRQYPKVQFGPLEIAHPEYKTFAKLFFFPNDFYEYVTYVNPGPRTKLTFSVAMSKERQPATPEELEAYETVVKSLRFLAP